MKRIALFQHHPICSRDCCEGMIHALKDRYSVELFFKDEVVPGRFDGFDIVAFPGGIGDSDNYYKFFTRRSGNVIADFIDRGGHYLGICMGAYWAGHYYFDILNGVKCEQYIKRPNADVRRSYGTVADVRWNGRVKPMYFYDGTAFVGDESQFETVARYANGDPAAIIQGRIGLIGPHPESQEYWYRKPYAYINKHWHHGLHHRLLLNFVDKLVNH